MRGWFPGLICWIALVFTSPGLGGENPPAAPAVLRVLSYNVQFLPGPGKLFNARGNDDYRARTLGQVLADYDIIGLNEVFELGPRRQILDGLKQQWGDRFHHVQCPEPGPKVGRYNAGLAIASRYPILDSGFIAYSQASSRKEFGVFADDFAAKGALHARARIRENPPLDVDVFTTHLDSKVAKVRSSQVAELAAFAKERMSDERPVLFLGDFNTRGNPKYQAAEDSEYAQLMAKLREARPCIVDLWISLGEGEGGTSEPGQTDDCSRIDYVFWGAGAGDSSALSPRSVAVRFFLDPKVKALSDHSAVEAIFHLPPR